MVAHNVFGDILLSLFTIDHIFSGWLQVWRSWHFHAISSCKKSMGQARRHARICMHKIQSRISNISEGNQIFFVIIMGLSEFYIRHQYCTCVGVRTHAHRHCLVAYDVWSTFAWNANWSIVIAFGVIFHKLCSLSERNFWYLQFIKPVIGAGAFLLKKSVTIIRTACT